MKVIISEIKYITIVTELHLKMFRKPRVNTKQSAGNSSYFSLNFITTAETNKFTDVSNIPFIFSGPDSWRWRFGYLKKQNKCKKRGNRQTFH